MNEIFLKSVDSKTFDLWTNEDGVIGTIKFGYDVPFDACGIPKKWYLNLDNEVRDEDTPQVKDILRALNRR
jgi:hypothetical protein